MIRLPSLPLRPLMPAACALALAPLAAAQTDTTAYGCGPNPAGSLVLLGGSGSLGETLTVGVDNPLGTQPAGSLALLAAGIAPDPSFPCGTIVPGGGMPGPYGDGELLISVAGGLNPPFLIGPESWAGPGQPAVIDLPIPDHPALVEFPIYLQGLLVEPGAGVAFSEAARIVLAACPGLAESGDEYEVGREPSEILAVDVSGDGVLDLVTVSTSFDDLHVLLGVGDGTFVAEPALPISPFPESLTAADFNADGRLDLAVTSDGFFAIDILLGTGAGAFAAPQPIFLPDAPTAVRSGDLDGDGDLDLAVSIDDSPADEVSIWLNQGNAQFLSGGTHPVGQDPESLEVADLNADGILDIVTANNDTDDLSILFGLGAALYAPEQRVPVGDFPRFVVARDVDLDGLPDLLAANSSDDSVSVLLGLGGGAFAPQLVHPLPNDPRQAELADLDLDGLPDLVATPETGSSASPWVSFGRGDGTFSDARELPGAGSLPHFTALGDFDGNGSVDAAFSDAQFAARRVVVLSNRCP